MANKKIDVTIECPCCGAEANCSITKNNTIFTWCKAPLENGDFCGYRAFLGRAKSREIITAYEQQQEQKQNEVQPIEEERTGEPEGSEPNEDTGHAANGENPRADEPPEPRGIAATVNNFIFGD